jgi:hypothetical protein
MMERMEVLSGHIDALIREQRAARAEIARLSRALQASESSRDKAVRELEGLRRESLYHSLSTLPVDDAQKPALRKSIDALIAEIDTILMQLHD